MVAVHLPGPGTAVSRSLPSLGGRRLAVSTSVISFSPSPRDHRCFRGLPFKSGKLSVSMCHNEHGSGIPGFETDTASKYKEDTPEQFIDKQLKSYPTIESVVEKQGEDMHDHGEVAPQQRKGAKIHDFCLGIPFGGLVFGGGLVGFLFSRNPANLVTGMLSGGAILALGVFSLKVWRQGMSSLPFILGQAAIAATLLWKHFQMYSLTKRLFPSGFYVLLSAAMLCFYSYVLISGGNPPPKKKLATTTSS